MALHSGLTRAGFGQLDAAALERIEAVNLQVLHQVGVAVDDAETRRLLAAQHSQAFNLLRASHSRWKFPFVRDC